MDLIYVDPETAERLFPACSQRLRLGLREAPVPRAEHLAAMKVQAMRNDPSQALARPRRRAVSSAPSGHRPCEVRGYFERAGLTDWYDKLVATL